EAIAAAQTMRAHCCRSGSSRKSDRRYGSGRRGPSDGGFDHGQAGRLVQSRSVRSKSYTLCVMDPAMNLTQVFLDQLEREAVRTRRALENVPKGKDDW